MGSGESTTRKVSFGVDEEDRVRVLRGVKLSEDVLQRMRTPSKDPEPRPPVSNKESPSPQVPPAPTPSPPSKQPPRPQPSPSPGATVAETQEELKRRYEREQALVQDQLARIARVEREAARQDLTRAVQRERLQTRQEADRAKQLPSSELDAWSKQLEKKEAELRALDAFYREQVAQLEKRNQEQYKMSTEQFHTAATRCEANIKPRNTEPVCADLQARILSCYRENRDQTLCCSDLAKQYMQCINAAKKSLLVNHG